MASFGKSLARAVEKHPVLYSRAVQAVAKSDDYDEAWEAVSYECNKPVSVIKSRWSKTIKALVQHTAATMSKTQSRKTRSSDFELVDELKFLLPFMDNNIEQPVTNPWESLNENDTQKEELIPTNLAFSPIHKPTKNQSTSARNSSASSNDNSKDALLDGSLELSTSTTTAGAATPKSAISNDKRKSTKSTNNHNNSGTDSGATAKVAGADVDSFFVSEPVSESSSSIRFRRILDEPAAQKQKDKYQKQTNVAGDVVAAAAASNKTTTKTKQAEINQTIKSTASNKILRTRSSSLSTERKDLKHDRDEDDDDEDDGDADADYKPPPTKKQALAQVKNLQHAAQQKARGRGRLTTANSLNKNKMNTTASSSPTNATSVEENKEAASSSPSSTTSSVANTASSTSNQQSSNKKSKSESEDEMSATTTADDDDDGDDKQKSNLVKSAEANIKYDSSIDLSLLEAAAAAEKSAKLEKECPTATTDAGTQCVFEADEEDDEFLARTRLWMQRMNPRQKLVFRKGVYQAFLDVYDDPRNFEMQKGVDKFVVTQLNGMPALFTGMSPVELRLVRQLAIAVAGSKLNNSPAVVGPKYSHGNARFYDHPSASSMKCASPSVGVGVSGSSMSMHHHQQRASATPSPARLTQNMERPPAVLRTTAIALGNQVRSPSGVQRVLRKVVRVDNSNGNASGGSGGSSSASNNNDSNSTQTSGSVGSMAAINSQGKQRIYRILPNGNIMRHLPTGNNASNTSGSGSGAGGGNNSSSSSSPNANSNNSGGSSNNTSPTATPTTASAATNANSTPTSTGTTTTSTLTSSTGTVISTRNISKSNNAPSTPQYLVDPKTGIRRLVNVASDGSATAVSTTPPSPSSSSTQQTPPLPNVAQRGAVRAPIPRRYSICSIPRELKQQQAERQTDNEAVHWLQETLKAEATSQRSSSVTKSAAGNTAAAIAAAASSNVLTPRPIVRVRYAQNQRPPGMAGTAAGVGGGAGQAARQAAAVAGASINNSQFALPNAVSPRKLSPNVVPIAVKCASGNNDNSENILKRAQEVYENALIAGEHRIQTGSATSSSSNLRQTLNRAHSEKSDCSIITPDLMDNFVVKNEPLEEDEDDEMLDDVMVE